MQESWKNFSNLQFISFPRCGMRMVVSFVKRSVEEDLWTLQRNADNDITVSFIGDIVRWVEHVAHKRELGNRTRC
jgi:hypothetical protein